MRAVDQAAQERNLPGVLLMERAGRAVVQAAGEELGDCWLGRSVLVLCGPGNNGGDGFVVARLLAGAGASVQVVLSGAADQPRKRGPNRLKGEAAHHLQLLRQEGVAVWAVDAPWEQCSARPQVQQAAAEADLVVDALLGTGISGEVTGPTADLIRLANRAGEAGTPVVAVDVPSGIDADTGRVAGVAVRACLTVTMIAPKLGLACYPAAEHVGKLVVASLGVPADLLAAAPAEATLLDPGLVRAWLPPRPPAANKGDFGSVLVVAGSVGMTGAACLAAEAALRAGAGIVRLAVPARVHDILEVKTTEVITVPLPDTPAGSLAAAAREPLCELAAASTVAAVGPGLSREPETAALVRELVGAFRLPLVLDADGLNALEGHRDLLAARSDPTVITPHPGEMARLCQSTPAQVQADRVAAVRRASRDFGCVVVLKGARTLVADEQGTLLVNPTGNSGMATGGTGDVLTGLIAGLMAQGAPPLRAAGMAAYLHGLAGDLAAEQVTGYCLVAGEVLAMLGPAFYAVLTGSGPTPYGEVSGE